MYLNINLVEQPNQWSIFVFLMILRQVQGKDIRKTEFLPFFYFSYCYIEQIDLKKNLVAITSFWKHTFPIRKVTCCCQQVSEEEVSQLHRFQAWYLFPEEYNLLQFHVRDNVTDMLIKHWHSEIHLESFYSNLALCFQIFGLTTMLFRDASWTRWFFQLNGSFPNQLILWFSDNTNLILKCYHLLMNYWTTNTKKDITVMSFFVEIFVNIYIYNINVE